MQRPRIGDKGSRTLTVTTQLIEAFAAVTGDNNPLHIDEGYASESVFGRCIAHGMLSASLISATIANEMPGPGTVYLNQHIRFKTPVFPGDAITASVEVIAIREDKPVVTLRTVCVNQKGVVVIDGEATVLVPI